MTTAVPSAWGAVWSSGPDDGKIVEVLKEASTRYAKAQASCNDLRVSGRFEPGTLNFELTIKGGKYRWDEDIIGVDKQRIRIFRLNDGQNFFMLNRGNLGIGQVNNFQGKWRDAAQGFYDFQMPMVDEGRQSVSEFCDWLIEGLRGTGRFDGERPFRNIES